MDESIECLCGCTLFWIFKDKNRCTNCLTENKIKKNKIYHRKWDGTKYTDWRMK